MTKKTRQRTAVIMAGGSGERFWPVSRKTRPKQLLRLTSPDRTLLQEAVARITPLIPPEDVFIITGKHLVEPIRASNPGVPVENVVAEPCKRNTAGCLIYAAAYLQKRYGLAPDDIVLAVLTADHQIADADGFRQTVSRALETAEQHEALVTIGVRPVRPETGYGYIEPAEEDASVATASKPLRVKRFHEKPNPAVAERYFREGRFFWNSGMFFWRLSVFLRELEHASPEMHRIAVDLYQALANEGEAAAAAVFERLPDISIDYALMEKARQVMVVPAAFPWDDIGAWDALDRTFRHDDAGNVAVGAPVLIDTRDSIVYNDEGPDGMAVGVIGLEGVVVAVAGDAVLVMPKDRAQDVRKIVAALKERGGRQL